MVVEIPERVTEALRIYLAAGWDANWEVIAGRMYRALLAVDKEKAGVTRPHTAPLVAEKVGEV